MPCSTFRLLIVILLTLVAYPAFAQVGQSARPNVVQVHGQVRLASGGGPAFNVIVRLESFRGGVNGETRTDRTGRFRFSGLTPGLYAVSVRVPGFKDVRHQVDLQTITSDYVQLQLVADKSATTAPAVGPGLFDAKVPAEAQKEFEKGRAAALDDKQVEKGLPYLERAVAIYPNFLEAQLLLGTAYLEMKQWDKAESALRRAIQINAKSTTAYFTLGEVYRRQKKYDEAEKALQDGLKLDDKSWQGYFEMGRVYWDMGNVAKAGPQVGRALQLKPDLAEGHLLAGNILLRARQPENALVEFEEYLRLAPKGEFAGQTRTLVQKVKQALAEKKK